MSTNVWKSLLLPLELEKEEVSPLWLLSLVVEPGVVLLLQLLEE